ncbi:MAG: hypothetical protein ACKVU4_06255 [Phycisphaerales bacterium]
MSDADPRTPPPPAAARRAPLTPGRRIALLVYLLSPLIVLALLVLLIFQAQRAGTKLTDPPKGAGAGESGMGQPFIDTRGTK